MYESLLLGLFPAVIAISGLIMENNEPNNGTMWL